MAALSHMQPQGPRWEGLLSISSKGTIHQQSHHRGHGLPNIQVTWWGVPSAGECDRADLLSPWLWLAEDWLLACLPLGALWGRGS